MGLSVDGIGDNVGSSLFWSFGSSEALHDDDSPDGHQDSTEDLQQVKEDSLVQNRTVCVALRRFHTKDATSTHASLFYTSTCCI